MSDAGSTPPPLPPEPPSEYGSSPPPSPPPLPPMPQLPPMPFESASGSGGGYGGVPPTGGMTMRAGDKPPGMVTTIGILSLVGGIIDVLLSLLWVLYALMIALGTFGIGLLCCIVPIIGIVSGVLSIIQGSKMLQNPALAPSPPLAIAQICSCLWCNVITTVCGVLILVFSKNPDAVAWYNSRR